MSFLLLKNRGPNKIKLDFFHWNKSSYRPKTESEEVWYETFIEGHWTFFLKHSCHATNNTIVRIWTTHKSSFADISRACHYCRYETCHKTTNEMEKGWVWNSSVHQKHLLELIIACHLTNIHTNVSEDVWLDTSIETKESLISKNLLVNFHWSWHFLSTRSNFSSHWLHSDLDNVLYSFLLIFCYITIGFANWIARIPTNAAATIFVPSDAFSPGLRFGLMAFLT